MTNNFDAMNAGASRSQSTADQATEKCEPAPSDWIEIELRDTDDNPVSDAPYQIDLTDGQQRRGILDSQGKARVEPIPSGVCRVGFSDTDFDLDWIGVQLVDEQDRPVAGADCEITLPDGQAISGITDDNGSVTVRNTQPGTCQVQFTAQEENAEPATDWIRLELVDEQDQPLKNQPYEVELPDGVVIAGILDSDGAATIRNIPEGACQITFPDDAQSKTLLLRLVTEDENPIPRVPYRLHLPDGTTHDGILDDQGKSLVRGIPNGQYRVQFG